MTAKLLQMILKHKANANCVKIKEHPDGLDFYFSVHNHCTKFLGFLQNILPIRYDHLRGIANALGGSKRNNYNLMT